MPEKQNKTKQTHRGEGVTRIGNQHTSFTHSTITNRDALYKPGRTHLEAPDLNPQNYNASFEMGLFPSSSPSSESIVHQAQQQKNRKIKNEEIRQSRVTHQRVLKIREETREWGIWILEKGEKMGENAEWRDPKLQEQREREKDGRKMGLERERKNGLFWKEERNEMRLKRSPAFSTFCQL